MKIVYYASVSIYEQRGVAAKIYSQINEWRAAGNEVLLITVSTGKLKETNSFEQQTGFIHYHLINKMAAWFNGGLFKLLNRSLTSFQVRKIIDAFSPDILYMRECIWFPFIGNLFKTKVPVVLEINSLLEKELVYYGFFQRTLYTLFQPGIYQKVKGIVGVTNEIVNYYSGYKKTSITISNGFDLKTVIPKEKVDMTRPQLVFAGSPGMVWHGVDYIIKMAELIPDFDFHIAGESGKGLPQLPNLVFHGYLSIDQMADLYARADISVGTLALFKNNMSEACPLKVREYLAYGLPVIIGYYDVGLSGRNLDFVLQIDLEKNSIETYFDNIRDFVYTWKNKRISVIAVEGLISATVKEQKRLLFFREIVG